MKTKRITSLVLAATLAQTAAASAMPNDIKDNKDNKKLNSNPYKSNIFINGLEVKKMLIDINYSKGVVTQPKYIVIHDTDNRNYGAGAVANRNYFANHPSAQASAHYTVDDKNIVQVLEDNWRGWHIGDRYAGVKPNRPEANNSNTIGIEITVNPDSTFDVAMKNAIELTKYLMKKHNIPAENIITHNDATGKICPRMMIQDKPYLWKNFKSAVGVSDGGGVTTEVNEGIYGAIGNVGASVNYSGTLSVHRDKTVSSESIGVVYNNERVQLNYIKGDWANITFKTSSGGSKTGFVKVDNLSIDGVNKVNKKATIMSSSPASVYKDFNNTYVESINPRVNVTLNYTFNQWANISYVSGSVIKSGFVNKQVLQISSEEDRGEITEINKRAKVINASAVNVREEATAESRILGLVYRDEEVRINFTKGEWSNVTFKTINGESKTGFMKGEYLTPIESGQDDSNTVTGGKGKVVNVTTNLRMRKGPGTSYDVVGVLYPNDTFDVIEKNDKWYRISKNGVEGYIHGDYVEIIKNGGSEITTPPVTPPVVENKESKGQVVNVTSALRMRSGAGTNFSILDSLSENDTFDILGKENGWYKIKYKNKVGYVHGDYVKEISQGGDTSTGNNSGNQGSGTIESGSEGIIENAPSGLRIRSGAGTNYDVVGWLKNGETVSIKGIEGSWVKIDVNGKTGYIHKDYVSNKVGTGNNNNNNNNNSNNSVASKGKVKNISSVLRIRENAGTNFGILGFIGNGAEFQILEKANGWYKIKYNSITGFIHGDYVEEIKGSSNSNNGSSEDKGKEDTIVINKRGKVVNVSTSLRVRSSNSENSTVIGYLTPGATFDILSKKGDWYNIRFDTYDVKKEGYVHKDYVEEYHEVETGNELGKKIVAYGKKFIGTPYLWGGTTPSGFDCSGFTKYVLNHFGIQVGRTTWDQIKNGKRIDISAVKEGDLIFFGTKSDPTNPTHVGIYIGNDEFIHSPKPGESVKISKLSTYGLVKIQANRVIN
ncbi:SH3 domain-containing protein [Clostridium hydrogeniformans]|uniref:SH3 domain-containing protein n=1 Tax=Clostridium hydrogeniformans TaxID=349933 RepID=UPI000489A3E9|nr:SH3 domain-containing protein [Clostridium hydrogeniformans]